MTDSRCARRAIIVSLLLVGSVVFGVVAADFLTNSVPVSGPVPIVAPDGPNATVTGSADINLTDPWPDAHTVELNTSEGNVTFVSNGPTNLSIAASEINGTWTNVTGLDVSSNELQIDPEDKPAVNVSGDAETLSIRENMQLDDGTVDFVYSGPDGSTTTLTLRGLPANTEITAADPTEEGVLDIATSDGSGTVTFTLPQSTHQVELLDVDETAPTQSNADPTGGISSQPSELSVDINDSDFPNDEVMVNISLDGSEIHGENITSNSTVTTSNFGTLDLGEHTWTVNTTDAYGLHTNATYTFELPSNVTFRNETNASQVITGVSLTATFYSEDGTTIIQRTDSNDDGNISLEGLPDTEFVIVVEADGFYTRRVYLESIFEQSNIYLLNSTAFPNAISTTFVYEDRTGQFPPDDTTLRVQRGVDPNDDGTFDWATVAGDFWGAAGEFPFTGETNARYRLIIENSDGDQRNLGTHIPTADGTKNIIVGQLEWPAINSTARGFAANLSTETNTILATYSDPEDETSEVRIRVYEYNNESNEIHDENFTGGPYGTVNEQISLTENQTDQSWIVEFTAQTDDDGEVVSEVPLGGSSLGLPIDPWLLGTFGWIAVTFIACLYGPRTSTIGAWVLVLFVGILATFQWVSVPGGAAAIIVAAGIAFAGTVYKEAMPG